MQSKPFTYKSIYDYLDEKLEGIDSPTDSQIKQAKQAYWKLWFAHYRKQRRNSIKEFTLCFDKQQLQSIHQKIGSHSVSKFLYSAVAEALNRSSFSVKSKELLDGIHTGLMQLISLMEELLDTEQTELTQKALEQLERIENQFNTLKNNSQ